MASDLAFQQLLVSKIIVQPGILSWTSFLRLKFSSIMACSFLFLGWGDEKVAWFQMNVSSILFRPRASLWLLGLEWGEIQESRSVWSFNCATVIHNLSRTALGLNYWQLKHLHETVSPSISLLLVAQCGTWEWEVHQDWLITKQVHVHLFLFT